MRDNSTYLRTRFAIDDHFTMVRNEWVRDQRITGNPLSLFLYLYSHDANFVVTRTKAMEDLGLGKDAYRAAELRLVEGGYLLEEQPYTKQGYRAPKRYQLLDPFEVEPKSGNPPKVEDESQDTQSDNPHEESLAVDNPKSGNPPKELSGVDNSEPKSDNPPRLSREIRPIKEDHFKEDLINSSLTSNSPEDVVDNILAALRLFDSETRSVDEILDIDFALKKIRPELSYRVLVLALEARGFSRAEIVDIDFVAAVRRIAEQAKGVVINNAVNYFASSLERAKDSLPKHSRRRIRSHDCFDCGKGVHNVDHLAEESDRLVCAWCRAEVTEPGQKRLLLELSRNYQHRSLLGVN